MTTGAMGATKRPTFLTVLCILSFVGIALSVIFGLKNYFDATSMAANTELNDFVAMFGMDSAAMAKSYLIVTLLNLLVLAGVWMMWKQKKMGFFMYLIGEGAQAIVPFVIIGGTVAGTQSLVMAIFAGVFIVMYALNLKHMS